MDGRPEPVQRVEVLRHAIAHVALEAVARVREAHPHHQPVAGDLGDDRGSRDRRHQRIAGDHRLAVTTAVDTVAAVDEDELGPDRQRPHRASERPQRCHAGYCRGSIRSVEPNATATSAVAQIFAYSLFALLVIELLGIVEAARDVVRIEDDGCGHHRTRSGPRPASSQPATGHTPFASARRSRRNVGRRISSPAAGVRRLLAAFAAAVRLMGAILRAHGLKSNGTEFRPRITGTTMAGNRS